MSQMPLFGAPGHARAPERADLRPYQQRFEDNLRGGVSVGYLRILGVAPTGAGKTVTMASIIHGAVAKGSPILYLAHRKELIDQPSKKLDELGIPHGVVMAKHWRNEPWHPVQVASVQTLVRRDLAFTPRIIFVDEAHHARAASYATILERWPKAIVIGMTATPWRTDNKGLGDLFQAVVVAATPRELQELGYLCPPVGFAYERVDLSGVRVTAGDYNERQLGEKMSEVRILGRMVEKWHEHAAGTRTVVFAVHVEHSQRIMREFSEARHHGAPIAHVEHLDGETPTDVREEILRRLERGDTQIVTNVGVLTEGTDIPTLQTILLARPTKSTGLFVQMTGRGARPVCWTCGRATRATLPACESCGSSDVKRTYRIHDHAGAVLEHGLPDMTRDYSLTADLRTKRKSGEAVEMRSTTICPKCFAIFENTLPECPACGHVILRRPREVVEVEARALTLEEAGKRYEVSAEKKLAVFKALVWQGMRAKRKPGWAAIVFKAKYGHYPPTSWRDAITAALRNGA